MVPAVALLEGTRFDDLLPSSPLGGAMSLRLPLT
jgi:hypothetical protein